MAIQIILKAMSDRRAEGQDEQDDEGDPRDGEGHPVAGAHVLCPSDCTTQAARQDIMNAIVRASVPAPATDSQ
jgi:hypothetical protein